MKKNVGQWDAFIRYFIATNIFGFGYYYGSWWGLAGFIPLLTAYFKICLLYRLVNWSTS